MSDYKAKMHQIRFPLGRWGPPPQIPLGNLQRSHRLYSCIKGAYFQGKSGERGKGKVEKKGKGGWKRRWREGFGVAPVFKIQPASLFGNKITKS